MLWFYLYRLAGRIARIVPLRAAYLGGDVIGTLLWWCWRGRRATAIENLTRVLGSRRAATRAARYAFLNYTRYSVDFLRAPKIRPENVLSKIQFDHWDRIDAAFEAGKGVIFVSVHLGNWDMGGLVLAARGYPMNVVADAFLNERTNDIVVRQRQQVHGLKVIPSDRAASGILRAMRRNEGLAILIDTSVPEGGGVEVTFFGERTVAPVGAARIALRTGARVIPVVLPRVRATSDQIVALVDLDVQIPRTGDDERDAQALTQRIMSAMEGFVRSYPDQWYMFRRMWPGAAPAAAPIRVRTRARRPGEDLTGSGG